MGKERVMKKIVAQIRARYPDVPYWIIASCYKLYGDNMAQIHSRIQDIYSAFGDHPQVIWKMKENELKQELEEKMKSEESNKIYIKKHTEGDSRVAKEVPTFHDFVVANDDHRSDVKRLMYRFADILRDHAIRHDWTKVDEPYRSMFYRDLCDTIQGRMNFMDGEWARLHYYDLERHHLKEWCPDDVNLLDVVEMLCDCVAAGMARSGDVYDVDISPDVLTKAVVNTVELLKSEIEVVDETVPIITDDGHLCCDACGCQIMPEQEVCEQCRRTISWNK